MSKVWAFATCKSSELKIRTMINDSGSEFLIKTENKCQILVLYVRI